MRLGEAPEGRPEEHVAELFEQSGWHVEREVPSADRYQPDLIARKGDDLYVVEIKSISQGRADRAIPLLSQAILQAQRYASSRNIKPLAVLYLRSDSSPSLLKHLARFVEAFAPDVAFGVIAQDGGRIFHGPGLDELNKRSHPKKSAPKALRPVSDLFSDLNQWMLKVLLAPQIPSQLLSAPRSDYQNVSQLADAADVSLMSASRFVSQLRGEGFLDGSSPFLKLARRGELFRRWQLVGLRPSREMPMKAVFQAQIEAHVRNLVSSGSACLGLFAAAKALKMGYVEGVPPYVYVAHLAKADGHGFNGLVPAAPGDRVDVILRQPRAPKSVFRGAVNENGIRVSDVLQVWLDVSEHPSRGHEQAEIIYKNVLDNLVKAH
jgi:hypothetical protein